MQRTLRNLYSAENLANSEPTPMEEYAADAALFQDAEPAEAESADGEDEKED